MTHPEETLNEAIEHWLATGETSAGLEPYADVLRHFELLGPVSERDAEAARLGREAFLAQAATHPVSAPAPTRQIGRYPSWRKERKPMNALVGILMALVVLFGGGGATAWAAQDALPSQWLYPVKLAGEGVVLGLTADPARQVAVLEDWAERRVQEMEQLSQAGVAVPPKTAALMQTQLEQALQVAARLDDNDLRPLMDRLRTRLETQLRVMQQLRTMDPNGVSLQSAERALIQARAEVQGALDDPAAFRLRNGTRRPAEAPVAPSQVPGQPGQGTGASGGTMGAGGGQGAPGGNPSAPGDSTCTQCTPQTVDGTCATCTPILWGGTPGPHGNGQGQPGGR